MPKQLAGNPPVWMKDVFVSFDAFLERTNSDLNYLAWARKAYDIGVQTQEIHYRDMSEDTLKELYFQDWEWNRWFEAGRADRLFPFPLTWGFRFGDVPKNHDGDWIPSYNHREQTHEAGVSMVWVDHPEFKSETVSFAVMAASSRKKVCLIGYLLPWGGGDDEPLMIPRKTIPCPHEGQFQSYRKRR